MPGRSLRMKRNLPERGYTAPAFCMTFKTKELRKLQFVTVRKKRAGIAFDERRSPPTPRVFISADSKGVAGDITVSADSTGLKVSDFSMSWKWFVSADSEGLIGAFCLLESKRLGSADSKEFSDW